MSKKFKCLICGAATDPKVDIVLTLGDKTLAPVHREGCAELARGVVTTGRNVLEARWPFLRGIRKAVTAIMTNGED